MKMVVGEEAVVSLRMWSGSVAKTGDGIRLVKNPTGMSSENICVEFGYPLSESMSIRF